jgi:hypothetical protein
MHTDYIAEMQGLYGPFILTERVLQKIWLRQDFAATSLQTDSGKALAVQAAGRWNVHEGPDFKEARLLIDGRPVVGDVEIHFNLSDWHAHQHECDSNFAQVVLHVVLHPERRQLNPVQTATGRVPELLYLMPLLNRDLESYAMDEALLALEQQDEIEWVVRFVQQPLAQRLCLLQQQAERRWAQKVRYAQQRLQRAGWEMACHQYALEVLGYKRNRAPMLRLADACPLSVWRAGTVDVDELFAGEASRWRLQGLRPANHPRRRLRQYLRVVERNPHWPDRLADCLQGMPRQSAALSTPDFRKAVGLTKLHGMLHASIFSHAIGATRLNTLMVDAILPLATAAGLLDGHGYWMHWPPGDSPAALRRFLKHSAVRSRQRPHSNGWHQGALALFLSRH